MPEFIGQLPTNEPQWNSISSVETLQPHEQGIDLKCDGNRTLSISVLAPNLIRVRFSPTGDFIPKRSWSVAIADEKWDKVPFEIEKTEESIDIKTEEILVRIQHAPCRVGFFQKNTGRAFASDTDLGIGWRDGEVACWKEIQTEEKFYGFGERTGLLNQRGKRFTHWNTDCVGYDILTDEMYQAIPFFMSLSPQLNYGLFFNTTYKSQFDVGANQSDILQLQTQGNELDYYLIYGQEPATILKTYTQLTGRISLPPRWALGYHQCRWSYNSEAEVRTLAREFRQRRIPCDVIHLDIDYMQGFRVFTWHKQRFPDPKQLINELTAQGFKVVTIVDPGVKYDPEADYQVCDRGLANNYFIRDKQGKLFHGYVWPDRSVFPDFLRSDVRKWWIDLHKNLIDQGVAGIWNDMNEPALDDRPFGDSGNKIYFPLDAPQGDPQERTNHAETHNIYGLMMARASREALDQLRPETRSFVLTRSGYAGVQKYSAVWTGDNHSLWEHLEMSLPMLCNLGLSGVAFVGADIGGFAGNATPELFARWMQVGMLYPFMRGHSMIGTNQHEPWEFGTEVEDICRQYIELRYQLLPYIYNLFWEAATTGVPILRPLLYHYSCDAKTYELYDQVLLGESLMAAPVYRPGIEHRAVYLPEGTWYDWWTGECYQGSKYILAHAPLAKMPMYIRGGSIIPLAPVMQYTSESPVNQLRLRVTPGMGRYILYEDDGNSFAYRDGLWSKTTYQVNTEGEQVIVDIQARRGNWNPASRQIVVEVLGKSEQEFEDDGTARRLQF